MPVLILESIVFIVVGSFICAIFWGICKLIAYLLRTLIQALFIPFPTIADYAKYLERRVVGLQIDAEHYQAIEVPHPELKEDLFYFYMSGGLWCCLYPSHPAAPERILLMDRWEFTGHMRELITACYEASAYPSADPVVAQIEARLHTQLSEKVSEIKQKYGWRDDVILNKDGLVWARPAPPPICMHAILGAPSDRRDKNSVYEAIGKWLDKQSDGVFGVAPWFDDVTTEPAPMHHVYAVTAR